VSASGNGRIRGADGCPTIGGGIVPAASVQNTSVSASAPDDHLAACPDCSVLISGSGRVGRAGWSPRVITACSNAFKNIAEGLGAAKSQQCSH
jgi:hypothetical protein